MKHGSAALLLLTLAAVPLHAQDAALAPGARQVTVALGIGNSFGWFGAQAERHIAAERLSLFAGLGFTPEAEEGDPTGITFAGGIRGFTRGENHRAFLELSWSQIATTSVIGVDDEGRRHYGPGVQLGYHYVADRGFTLLASLGVGKALDADEYFIGSGIEPMLALGAGFTWR